MLAIYKKISNVLPELFPVYEQESFSFLPSKFKYVILNVYTVYLSQKCAITQIIYNIGIRGKLLGIM
jgi:hypothetical protein